MLYQASGELKRGDPQALLQGPHFMRGLAKRAGHEALQPADYDWKKFDYDWKTLVRLAHSPQVT